MSNRRVIPPEFEPLVAQVIVNLIESADLLGKSLQTVMDQADDINREYDEWLEQQK